MCFSSYLKFQNVFRAFRVRYNKGTLLVNQVSRILFGMIDDRAGRAVMWIARSTVRHNTLVCNAYLQEYLP